MRFKFLVIILSTFFSVSLSAQLLDKVVARVDGTPILQSQVATNMTGKINNKRNRRAALDELINDMLVDRAIKDSGLNLDYAAADRAIDNIAAQNGLTFGQLLDALDYQHINYNQYRYDIAKQILMGQIIHQTVSDNLVINRDRVEYLAKKNDKKDKKVFKDTQYLVRHILLKTNPILSDQKAQQELTKIRSNIINNKISFAAAADKYSNDYASTIDGGKLGWNFADIYDPAFAKVIKTSKMKQISQPFKSNFGWHILEVLAKKQVDRSYDLHFRNAYDSIAQKQGIKQSQDWVNILRKKAKIEYLD